MKTNELLDLAPHIGQVASSVRFDLCGTAAASTLGELHPGSDSRMSITNNTTANIKRTISGFEVPPDEAAYINLFTDRVCPFFILEDGSEWPCGEFLFASEDPIITTTGRPLKTTLFDQTFILSQPRRLAFGCDRGENLITNIVFLAQDAGIDIDRIIVAYNNDKIVKDPISWPSGTPRSRMMNELATLAGYFSPYFDNRGDLVIRPAVEVLHTESTILYQTASPRIIVDTLSISPNLLQAPNVYIAINNGSQEGEVVGRYEIPAYLPHSVQNRGFEVVEIVKSQGINSTQSADDMAKAAANQSPRNFEQAQFESPPDPRHDTFDTVELDGEVYIEVDWAMELSPGGSHRHNLRRVIDPDSVVT